MFLGGSGAGGKPTDVSCASSICSERPIKSTSGRWFTHSSFSCVSAVVRCTLSGDCRPCSRLASAVWTSAGRTDMLIYMCVCMCDNRWRGPRLFWERSHAGKGLGLSKPTWWAIAVLRVCDSADDAQDERGPVCCYGPRLGADSCAAQVCVAAGSWRAMFAGLLIKCFGRPDNIHPAS